MHSRASVGPSPPRHRATVRSSAATLAGRHESGLSLFPALIFLLVLALLGMASLNSTMMEERMVGSTKDSNLAFQAAEAGLRDAEADIEMNVGAGTAFTPGCPAGLCTPPSTWPSPTSTDISKLVDWNNDMLTRHYGLHTGASALPQVAVQPAYVIERLANLPVGAGSSVAIGVAPPPSGGTAYRVTVLATGARPETRVTLQSTYVVRQP